MGNAAEHLDTTGPTSLRRWGLPAAVVVVVGLVVLVGAVAGRHRTPTFTAAEVVTALRAFRASDPSAEVDADPVDHRGSGSQILPVSCAPVLGVDETTALAHPSVLWIDDRDDSSSQLTAYSYEHPAGARQVYSALRQALQRCDGTDVTVTVTDVNGDGPTVTATVESDDGVTVVWRSERRDEVAGGSAVAAAARAYGNTVLVFEVAADVPPSPAARAAVLADLSDRLAVVARHR